MAAPLPIDPLLPEVVRHVRERGTLVLQAEPGAGKTTRVPPALLDHGVATGEVVILEPRRLAARLAARRVAEERGERIGETVGYQVRFEDVSSKRTRLRFVTEGILTRRLLRDPLLEGVSTVFLDEFHERHLEGDLALALLANLKRTKRPDLQIVVASATLDAGPVASYLGGAPVVSAPGRAFPVAIEHDGTSGALDARVASAVDRLARAGLEGDVLVFLPGAAEIRAALAACAPVAARHDLAVFPLHGSLPPEEQDRAIRPSARRKVILSTNVAESSVTIEGVVAVIDSGLARVAGHSWWTGLPTLELEAISRASAKQRAGRAGRTRPGRCLRLYSQADHDARPAFAAPEVQRLDLAGPVLELLAEGLDPSTLGWLDAPPGAAIDQALSLLEKLGAIEGTRVTKLGERLIRFPLHPRLARMVVESEEQGCTDEATTLAALLSERPIDARPGASSGGDRASDAIALVSTFRELRGQRGAPDAVRNVDRVREQLARLARGKSGGGGEEGFLRAILAAFPDRVAQRRGGEWMMFDGSSVQLARESRVQTAPFLVAVDAREQRGARGVRAIVQVASPIEPDWLLDEFPHLVREVVDVTWDGRLEKVIVSSKLLYGAIVLDESARGTPPEGEVERILSHHALVASPEAFADREQLQALDARSQFARTLAPDLPELNDAAAREALKDICQGRRSFRELRELDLVGAMLGRLTHEQRRTFDRLAPPEVTLPGGRRLRVHYAKNQPPWVESRLQDFFGSADGPRVGGGQVPLTLHLLAPSQRPVQITSDLAGFWVRHYPSIRRELCRRYPRHAWPEDPLAASPPAPGGRKKI